MEARALHRRYGHAGTPRDPDFITQGMLGDASDAVGYELDEDVVRNALELFASRSTPDLRAELRRAQAEFRRDGGRGVTLAEIIDKLKIALAARKRQANDR